MKLPNGNQAIVEEQKLLGYILNPLHPIGKDHARLFDTLLGINLFNADVLRAALSDAAREGNAIQGKQSGFGTKYEIRFEMTGPRGSYTILSIGIVTLDSAIPRLITTYIE